MTDAPLYPPNPTGVPRSLTRPGFDYLVRVAGMIGGLFAFLLIYLGLIAFAVWFAYFLVVTPIGDGPARGVFFAVILKYGGTVASALLAVFLVKGLFKGQSVEREGHTRLREADHPLLFAFIRQVHWDAGAPAPRHVYVCADVNAALIYDTSLINLIVPPRKDLLIGLGLVNVANLSEFKARLAREFGYFAQKTTSLGSYLYVANRVMHDIIYTRDALDRLVDEWAEMHVFVAFPALGLKAILAGTRTALGWLYHHLNMLHLSLGRQMEFNADNVAVSLAGSDALIHGLARLPFATECLTRAGDTLRAAADHGLFTDDLFYHHTRVARYFRRARNNPRLGRPPDEGGPDVRVFEPETDGLAEERRTHPTNYAREQNAKRVYVPGPRDERSPWLLFGPDIRREATTVFYQVKLNRIPADDLRPAAEVQAFIDAELVETTYDARYQGWYDNRLINPGDVELPPLKPWPEEQIDAWLAAWPPPDLGQRLAVYRALQEDERLLRGIGSGQLKLKKPEFDYRDVKCSVRDVPRLVHELQREMKRVSAEFDRLDREGFLAHWCAARYLDDGAGTRVTEIQDRYRFHLVIQQMLQALLGDAGRLQGVIDYLGHNPQVPAEDLRDIRALLSDVQRSMGQQVMDARRFRTPPLTNIAPGTVLRDLLADKGDPPLAGLHGNSNPAEFAADLAVRLEALLGRVKRIHFKSLGGLLACQEYIAHEWATHRGLAEAAPPFADSVPVGGSAA
jgi:hypothetical protein